MYPARFQVVENQRNCCLVGIDWRDVHQKTTSNTLHLNVVKLAGPQARQPGAALNRSGRRERECSEHPMQQAEPARGERH